MDKHGIISFIVNNDEIELLKARVNSFNPLKILKVQDYEIRHSNILAWVLDPNENHNLDDRITKRFLLRVLLSPTNGEVLESMDIVYMIQKTSFMDLKVYREMNGIDIVLVSEKNKIVIFIENKVYSEEHSNQLERYYDSLISLYPEYDLIPVFLTLDEKEPTDERYYAASYDDLLETLEFIILNYKDRTTLEVVSFLNYYIRVLKEKYSMDNELKKLCKDIYEQNKEVIDLIYTVGNEIDMDDAVNQFKTKYTDVLPVDQKSRTFWFIIKPFFKAKKQESHNWAGGYPVSFWFSEYYGKLKIALEVGPFDDSTKRTEFLNSLESNGVKISEKSKEPGRKYTRIYTITTPIKDWSDSEEVLEAMEKLYEKKSLLETSKAVIQSINDFNWEE